MARKNSDIIRFITPASWWGEKWRDGLLSGDGNVGANVYGGAVDERILINDVNLRWQGRVNVVPDIALKLKELRKKLDIGDMMTAQKVMTNALASKHFAPRPDCPLPIGELMIKMYHTTLVSDYARQVNLESGEVSVSYVANGTRFNRDLFVSRDSSLIILNMSKQGSSSITTDVTFGTMHRVNSNTKDGVCPMPEGVSIKADKEYLYFAARNDDDGSEFGVVVRFVANSGTIKTEGTTIKVSACNNLTVIISTFTQGNKDRDWVRLKSKLSVIKDSYDRMLRTHTAIHNKLYSTADISLTNEDDSPIEALLMQANNGDLPPLLVEKLYKLGRYLMVSATSTSGRLLGPTGLWNGNYRAYRSAVNLAGEMQMTYLHTLQGNMLADIDKSFDQFEQNIADYQNNAMRLFGCNGILVPAVAAPNTGRLGTCDLFAVHYTGCGAWLSNYYYRYAKYTNNNKFVKTRLLPFMKEVALFYEDFFVINDGKINIAPSTLFMRLMDAERIIDRPVIGKNSCVDFEVARHFFANLIDASKNNNIYGKDIARWEDLMQKFPEPEISSEGIFKEFVNSTTSVDYSGVSVGTLYPAFFGSNVNFLSDEQVLSNYERTADKKMQEYSQQNSYYMAILSSVYARIGNSIKAKQCISNCLRACATANLTFVDKDWRGMGLCGSGIWTPVQLQTNMVVNNTVQQLLMYSHNNIISVIHCVPSEWKDIAVQGMLASNGVTVDFATNSSKQTLTVKLYSKQAVTIDLYVPLGAKKFVKNSPYSLTKTGDKRVISNLDIPANKVVTLELKYLA